MMRRRSGHTDTEGKLRTFDATTIRLGSSMPRIDGPAVPSRRPGPLTHGGTMGTTIEAKGHDWHRAASKPAGGFRFMYEQAIYRAWHALQDGRIGLRDFRVWLACHELRARRCVVGDSRVPNYTLEELGTLVGGVGGEHLRRSLRALERENILTFDGRSIDLTPGLARGHRGRLIPVPRPVLRHLCRATGRAYLATALGHLLRCLFYRTGQCRSGGWCKSSWVAYTFGVAIRAVKEARQKLVQLGILLLAHADQLRLNRFGKPVLVSLEWGSRSAPRNAESTTGSAPPREHKKLSYRRSEHQKPARAADPAGARTRAKEPDLFNITVDDLKDPWRLAALFKQARLRGWIQKTEANILAVFAAAAHSLRVKSRNRPGLFYWIVSRQAWDHVSCEDEDIARSQIKAHFRTSTTQPSSRPCE